MARPKIEQQPTCAWDGCTKDQRSKGYCDTHYRHFLRREQGVGGIEPLDDVVYKVRVRGANGTQPFYYSKPEAAMAKVAEARADGSLLYFAEYVLSKKRF